MKSEKVKFLVGIILGAIVILIAFNYQSIYQYFFTKEITKIPEKIPTPIIEYKETKVTFLAVGDMMMSRGVNSVIARTNDTLRPFSGLAELLDSTDFNFGNLESPISGSDKPGPPHSLVFNTPIRNVEGLKRYKFKVLNLANNHALDQRAAGLENTRKVLAENEITYLGVGADLSEAWKPKIITVNGLRLGFLGASYASVNDGGVARNNLVARIEDTEYLKNSLESLKKDADFIVVTMHAGVEYVRQPHQPQIDFAHAAIDYGADLVIGAHPHWIQIIEKYKDKYIFYSLGNFIFDQEWSQDTKEGLVLKVSLEGQIAINPPLNTSNFREKAKLKEIELIPVIIENYSTPRLAKEEEKTKILAKISLTDTILTTDTQLQEIVNKK
ncbi:MAG: CapA family protein [Blastocatellia bacterium]|nr:CapA family protein [Blastocatellia bacterium]